MPIRVCLLMNSCLLLLALIRPVMGAPPDRQTTESQRQRLLTTLRGSGDGAETVAAIRQAASQRIAEAVPLLEDLYRGETRSTRLSEPNAIRVEVVRALPRIGTANSRRLAKDILAEYLRTGTFSPERHYWYDDRELHEVVTHCFPFVIEAPEHSWQEWLRELAMSKEEDYRIRAKAYEGYLRCEMGRQNLETVPERVSFLLPKLRSVGHYWEDFHSDDPRGRTWPAAAGRALCELLIQEGLDAVPLLRKGWSDIQGRGDLSEEEQRRCFAIAHVLHSIYERGRLTAPGDLPTGDRNVLEKWKRSRREYVRSRRGKKTDTPPK